MSATSIADTTCVEDQATMWELPLGVTVVQNMCCITVCVSDCVSGDVTRCSLEWVQG